MKKYRYYYLAGALMLLALIVIAAAVLISGNKLNVTQVKIGNAVINVELALTPAQQYQGLSDRDSLCADCGMLFVFAQKTPQTFVMRRMRFPLDIIFINNNKIIKIYKNLAPEGESVKNYYESGEAVDYVLEVNGGVADAKGIKIGDEVRVEN